MLAALFALGSADTVAGVVAIADRCIVGQSVFGCRSERDIEQIISYHDDVAALREALAMSIASGTCTQFADGERVFVTERASQSDRTAVRRPGETESFWIAASWSRPATDCSQGASRSIYAKLGVPEPIESRAAAAASAETASPPATTPQSRSTTCTYKPVMTDAEIAQCRVRQR